MTLMNERQAGIDLSDQDILRRLADTEDNFSERKTFGDIGKDAAKTVCAFANSAPVGYPCLLFVGVRNDGSLENKGDAELDNSQKTISDKCKVIYPPLYMLQKCIKTPAGESVLAVIIPGSGNRPHFTGRSYVRRGSESIEASDQMFGDLIAERNSKTYFLRKWIGRVIIVSLAKITQSGPVLSDHLCKFIDCNQFYLTYRDSPDDTGPLVSWPLSRFEISYDHTFDVLRLIENVGGAQDYSRGPACWTV